MNVFTALYNGKNIRSSFSMLVLFRSRHMWKETISIGTDRIFVAVEKYRNSGSSGRWSNRLSRMSFHSVAKKSSRIGLMVSSTFGFTTLVSEHIYQALFCKWHFYTASIGRLEARAPPTHGFFPVCRCKIQPFKPKSANSKCRSVPLKACCGTWRTLSNRYW